jgi:hypothetical protein
VNPANIRDDVCYLYDLKIGDAGAGYRRHNKVTVFSQLFPNIAQSFLNPFTSQYTVAQDPPSQAPIDQCRLRLFHVKFYGQSLIRMGSNGDDSFLPDRKGCGPDRPLTQVSTPLKGWIQTDDGMWEVFDILGRRYFEVYALHVQAGFLAPSPSYLLKDRLPDGSQDTAFDGIVDQSCVGVEISEVVVNSGQGSSPDDETRCVVVPPADTVVIPVPSGARSVCVSMDAVVLPGFRAFFSWNPSTGSFKGASEVEFTAELAPTSQTRRLCIPDTPFIRFFNGDPADPVQLCLTFGTEI